MNKKLSTEDFNRFLEERLSKISETLAKKSKEYVRNNDKLHNFNTASRLENISRERALHGMLLKHYISYLDILEDIDNNKLPSIQYVEEKYGDIINYFILSEISLKHKIYDIQTNNNRETSMETQN